jgi:hypothetical protein
MRAPLFAVAVASAGRIVIPAATGLFLFERQNLLGKGAAEPEKIDEVLIRGIAISPKGLAIDDGDRERFNPVLGDEALNVAVFQERLGVFRQIVALDRDPARRKQADDPLDPKKFGVHARTAGSGFAAHRRLEEFHLFHNVFFLSMASQHSGSAFCGPAVGERQARRARRLFSSME